MSELAALVEDQAGLPPPATALDLDSRGFIEWLARRKIAGFTGTIDENGQYLSEIYAGSASMSDSITADYHGRFLIELIQNANDVHPDDRLDGEIEVVFDQRDGDAGTLYVANRGAPFSERNVRALCDMGLSSKPPGESIGNKGLGFRSVNHITDAPRVFSQMPGLAKSDLFQGYCFRFADEADLETLISDTRARVLAQRDLPLFHVPVWIDEQPERIRAFAQRGFSTVVALPLRSAAAATDVLAEIASVRTQSVPLLLFLKRLCRLSISVVDTDGAQDDAPALIREERSVETGSVPLSVVELGAAGSFLIARRTIAESAMKTAIRDGTGKKQLHKHWKSWEGEGEIALAVRLDAALPSGRLYTYLPMGEQAISPFAGHLHGSFFPTSNRKGVDATIALNALLLAEAADLAAETILLLSQLAPPAGIGGMSASARATAAIDLLVWNSVDSLDASVNLPTRVASRVAARSNAKSLSDVALVPCLSMGGADSSIGWASASRARRWRYTLATFTAEVAAGKAATTGVTPIWPGLGARIDGLIAYLSKHVADYVDSPTAAERAALATDIAADLAVRRRFSEEKWTSFYRDLPAFLDKSGSALSGLAILWCGDGKLRAAMAPIADAEGQPRRRKRAVLPVSIFAPPARRGSGSDDEQQLKLPETLTDSFGFLSNQLDWYGDLAEARDFLEKSKLVFSFDREEILTQLSRIVRADGRNAVRSAGLRWAFQIWREPRDKGRAFKLQPQHRFLVPTFGGDFIEAREAVFSDTWAEETRGRLIQRFLDAAPCDSEDIATLADRRLAPRNHYSFKSGRPELWTAFLIELGVQRGLAPVSKKVAGTIYARAVKDFSFCAALGISADGVSAWKADILAHDANAMGLKSTNEYFVSGDILWMPGQGDFPAFSRECQEIYAQLVIAWLAGPMPKSWDIDVYHYHFIHDDSRLWPTPLKSFLRSAPWIPADEPTTEAVRKTSVTLSQIWISGDSGDRFPSFLRRPSIPVMRALERATEPQLAALRRHAGLKTLGDPGNLFEQADFLAEQFARDGFDRYFERHLLNLYHTTWHLLAGRVAAGTIDPAGHPVPTRLLVRSGHETVVADMAAPPAPGTVLAYVRDGEDETGASLVEAAGLPWFDSRSSNPGSVAALLRKLYGTKIRLLSEAQYQMVVDGRDVGEGTTSLLLESCPRLRLMCAVAMEGLKGAEFQRLPSDRHQIIAKLERLLLQRATTISFRIDGVEIDDDDTEKPAFALKLTDGRAIVVARETSPLGWTLLDDMLGALCEAIDLPGLEANLRLLLFSLQRADAGVADAPDLNGDLDLLAATLRLTRGARRTVRETLGAQLERYLPWLRAILHLSSGPAAVEAFAALENDAVQDIAQLREAISPWLLPLQLDGDRVIDACRVALDVAELRDDLGFDFAAWNASLVAVGESADVYPETHASQMLHYVRDHDRAIIDSLRALHLAGLKQGTPAPAYATQKTEIYALAPDPAWLLLYREVPDELLAARVDLWLGGRGATGLDQPVTGLDPLDVTRDENGATVRKLVASGSPLVRAWCAKAGVAVPRQWLEIDAGAASIRALLEDAGIFESFVLDDTTLFDWLVRLSIWPSTMLRSLDRVALGIVENDLNAERAKARSEADARKKESRSVPFNGRKVDPEDTDWQALSEELAHALSRKMLGTAVGSTAKLQPAKSRIPGRRGGSSGGSTSRGFTPPPQLKTDMIGRLGEIAVYHWLRTRLPDQDIDAAWISGNATLFTNRPGDDSCGFDFEIGFRGQRWQIEVKTSLNDPCAFQLGETEVRAGRAAARARSGVQYWIAYVSNIGAPEHARVEMLPNPMGEEGEAVLNLLGEGLRYGFVRQ